ncbi:MAG: 50S ribosomal protein L25/general stress protein Ctc [Nocardiopsis sp. BM-2018]|uniref:Large ribosomal subunit protein bL25 n=1 Tax=Nocardiopsis metallicus TaxID=179819 RepID=A0A840WMA3_9ACTN|nr:50S ribosomal protein L25/general stress protein Ctc [Nocardiopsis metallicus]MBB5492925.1 large subunit ribosomal protein L25 [Nocardiopsis metallicus]QRN80801.1 MAG: 50S ribosomal protein L25/general stress protein Ctc [Nocardiopsis sp. BM-2018]
MSEVRIAAEPRTEFGKGASRRARRAGKVPAVLYGHGTEPRHLNLPGHDLMLALKTPNVLIRLEGLDKDNLALPKSVQRDAIKGFLEHIDLLVVSKGEKVEVEINVSLTGEVKAPGVLNQELVTVTVEAEATHIPNGVEFDIEGLEIGATPTAADLKLPEGVTLVTDPESLLLTVSAPRVEEEPETSGEASESAEAAAAE